MNRKLTVKFLLIGLVMAVFSPSCLNTKNDIDYTPEREHQLLQEYLSKLVKAGHDVDTTSLGVYYVTREEGSGDFPQQGDTLSVKYVGYLITGEMFDASFYHSTDTDSTIKFVFKDTEMIKGWDDMMGVMKKGQFVEFAIPSNLAYGASGSYTVPPYSTLVFVAKLYNILPKKEEEATN